MNNGKAIGLGILNAIFPGLSYILLKKRIVFGWTMLLSVTIIYAIIYFEPQGSSFLTPESESASLPWLLASLLSAVGFGYDAYDLAKESKK